MGSWAVREPYWEHREPDRGLREDYKALRKSYKGLGKFVWATEGFIWATLLLYGPKGVHIMSFLFVSMISDRLIQFANIKIYSYVQNNAKNVYHTWTYHLVAFKFKPRSYD